MGLVSRFMHFEGRPLLEALPRAVDHIDDYDWLEGEVTGGMILGWNFGDGHLNGRDLLEAIQPQCGFEPGELRVIAVESQPLFTPTMHWQVFDAATGLVDQGTTELNRMRDVQPWPTGEYAEALLRGQSRTTG
jgi:nitrite reductase/ring-hydroxylating ferredoxin subunit